MNAKYILKVELLEITDVKLEGINDNFCALATGGMVMPFTETD